jgi:hypothetical protein
MTVRVSSDAYLTFEVIDHVSKFIASTALSSLDTLVFLIVSAMIPVIHQFWPANVLGDLPRHS